MKVKLDYEIISTFIRKFRKKKEMKKERKKEGKKETGHKHLTLPLATEFYEFTILILIRFSDKPEAEELPFCHFF